jgi:hypothetical protein
MEVTARQCPFKEKRWTCNNKCEWYNTEFNTCVVNVTEKRIYDFTKIIMDYISTSIKIKKATDG